MPGAEPAPPSGTGDLVDTTPRLLGGFGRCVVTGRATPHCDLAARLVALPHGVLGRAEHPDVLALAMECEIAGYGMGQLYLIATRHAWRVSLHGLGGDGLTERFGRIVATIREALIAEALTADNPPPEAVRMPTADWSRHASVYQQRPGEPLAMRWARAT